MHKKAISTFKQKTKMTIQKAAHKAQLSSIYQMEIVRQLKK